MGISIWRNPKDAFNRREYPPGQHGVKMKRRQSTFKRQLVAKQRLKAYCNLPEKPFRRRYKKAEKGRHNTVIAFMQDLATKLDVFLFDAEYPSDSIFAVKQFIGHGFVFVNGIRVTSRGYNLVPGDVVSFSPKLFQIPHVKEHIAKITCCRSS